MLSFPWPVSATEFDYTKYADQLEEMEVIVLYEDGNKGTAPTIITIGLFDNDPDALWGIIDNCSEYKNNLLSISRSKETYRKDNIRHCKITVDLPFPLPNLSSTTEATNTVVPGIMWKRTWKLLKGDYEHNSGSWVLYPYGDDDEYTLAIYTIQAVPNIFVPQGLVDYMRKRNIPKLYKKLRQLIQDEL